MPKTSNPPRGEEQPQPRQRNRDKGFLWLGGAVINPERPLGLAWPGRPWRDVPVVLQRRERGGAQVYDEVINFDLALELNARAVCAYVEAARDDALSSEVEQALAKLPELSDDRYGEAVGQLTNNKSVAAHQAALADQIAQAVCDRKHVAALAQLLRIRRVLNKGRRDARLLHERRARFVRDGVDNNRHSSEAVLLRTFLPFALVDRAMASVRQIQAALALRHALRRSSNVTVGDLALMAFHGQVHSSDIYLDYDYLDDLIGLAIYAGARARGASHPFDETEAATYRAMLCLDGEDSETDANLRRERADLAAALRTVWRQVPGLVEATRQHGSLASMSP